MLGVLFFYAFAILVAAVALMMVFTKNLVHAALYMAATFLLIAFLYILMGADYVGAVQILVYVGAISILFVFGIMLTKRDRIEGSNAFNRYGPAATVVAALLFVGIVVTATGTAFKQVAPFEGDSTIQTIAELFLSNFVLAFEFAGVLLLAALIAAIAIGQSQAAGRGRVSAQTGGSGSASADAAAAKGGQS